MAQGAGEPLLGISSRGRRTARGAARGARSQPGCCQRRGAGAALFAVVWQLVQWEFSWLRNGGRDLVSCCAPSAELKR